MRFLLLKYILSLIFFPLISSLLCAQDKDNIIELITDRPDQTESSSVVPARSSQLETGFIMDTDETGLYKQKSFTYNTTLLRYGLLDNMELRLGIEYLGQEIDYYTADTINCLSGLSPLYTGFKVKITEEDGWKPEIAFIGGLILPFTANEDFKPQNSAASFRFAFSHTLSKRFSLGYNLGVEWDGESAVPGYFYSLASGIGIFKKVGMFIECYGLIREDGDAEHMVDTGFTYLILPNFQLDLSGGIGINDKATDRFISFGFTYRIPR
jgi:hypothetical protein